MPNAKPERRLAAIVSMDVAGYSRMMEADEAGTHARLKAARDGVIQPAVARAGGRVVKTTGDGLLVEFPSAVTAVECAAAVQTALAADPAAGLPFRIGVNLGDVIADGDDVYGDGVNLAARLQELAPEGGVAFSAAVHDQVQRTLDLAFQDAGDHKVKNIQRPIRVWTWRPGGATGPTRPTLEKPDKPSIAVLPFDNMSADPEQSYLADGVVEAITAALSRIRSFFVIARNSAFTYKGKAANVREIGRELGVAYVLEGSVQRAGDRLRITVQLIETEAGGHIWAERYDGSMDEIFDLQDRITEQVAGALQPSIRIAEAERSMRKRPQDLGAYDYTMRAMPHVWVLQPADCDRALALLEQALAIDPDYPLALSLAGWCHAQRSVYNWSDDLAESQAQALKLAERAAELSGDDPLILAVLGTVHTFVRNFGTARILLERAVTLDPNDAWAWSRLGWLEVYGDKPDSAIAHFERALRLSPLDPINFNNYVGMASAHQVAERYDEAVECFRRALEERPNALWILRNLAVCELGAGREAEARRSFARLMEAYPDLTVGKVREAMVFTDRLLDTMCSQLKTLGLPD